ncbi:PQQ-binding-like beta-propeller repeat protein, partial [bacterium]|nr:PQQ-binding-like beta-propeller repeat protein [bacterium]
MRNVTKIILVLGLTLPVFLGCSKYLDVDFVGDWQVKAHPKSNYENNNIAKEKIDFEGKLAWRTKIGKPLKASPLAVDSFLLIGSPGRRIYSIDLNSGEVLDGLWVDISIAQELFYSNGLLFITGDDDWNKLIALDLIRNEILWEKSAAASIIPPIAYDNKLYFTTRMGKLFCIDPDNGEKLWEFNLHDIVNTIPVFWANRVLHCNLRGDIFVLDADSGTLISELKKTGDVSSFPVKYESYIFVPYIDGRMVIYSEHGLEKI